jgi:hypothetical protein
MSDSDQSSESRQMQRTESETDGKLKTETTAEKKLLFAVKYGVALIESSRVFFAFLSVHVSVLCGTLSE